MKWNWTFDPSLFLFLLASWFWEPFYLYSLDKFIVYSACCKLIFLVHVDIIIKIYSLCLRWCFYVVFSLILFLLQSSTFPYLFSFDEPRSISDLGLNYDIRAMVYGGNIGILPSGIYVFGGIEGIIWKFDVWG